MQLVKRVKIYPTESQTDTLWSLSNLCRIVYNFSLAERKDTYANTGKGVSYKKQQNDLPELKKQYPHYKAVYSKVLQMALRTLDANYRSFFALRRNGNKEAQPPKFKGKKHFFTMKYNQSGFSFDGNTITLSHKLNDIPLSFELPIILHDVSQVDVFQDDKKQFWLSFVCDISTQEYHDNELHQAWDLGITKHTAVNIQGRFTEVTIKRPDRYWKSKITSIQSRRDHCKKYSLRWKRLNANLNRMKRKSSNQGRDFDHKLSKKSVENTKANTIIVGDLNVKQLCQLNKYQKGLHASLHNTGHISRFVGFLAYKAERLGKRVIEIDERDTTKTCCSCGKRHNMPLSKREMMCDCGNLIDRDRNSAVNIMIRFLSQNALWTSYQHFADNVRQTGLSIDRRSYEAPSERVV